MDKKNILNYDKVYNSFNEYVLECKRRVKDTFFSENYLAEYKTLRNNLINAKKIDKNSNIEDAIKFERLEMIDIKINHTMRVVEGVLLLANKMGTNIEFNKLLKICALLHDIGRFDQATWNNNFSDLCYKNIPGIQNHAHAGYHILFNNNRIEQFNIDKKFYKAIGAVIYNHSDPILKGDLSIKLENIDDLNISNLNNLNNEEKIIIAVLVQMIRDIDMLDILYQNLTGEIELVPKEINFKVSNRSIFDIAKYWDIDYKYLLSYNSLYEEEVPNIKTIKIPVDKINIDKLSVPNDIKQKFFNNENIDLREIMTREDWTFITGMWWRLNHFLNNINFKSNLELIKEYNLLEKIYNKYPSKYKVLVYDAFSFAYSKLVEQQLKEKNLKFYINHNI